MTKLFAVAMVACIAVACSTEESATPVASVSAAATSAACVCVCPGDDAAVPRPEAAADAAPDVSLVSVDASALDAATDAREASASEAAVEAAAPAAGLHIVGSRVLDAQGRDIILKGMNVGHYWDSFPISEALKFPGNSVRVVFGRGQGVATTTADRKAVVQAYTAGGKIAIPGVWADDITCGTSPSAVFANVAQWVSDKSYLVGHEDNVIVNIANEWGDFNTTWRDTYISAVQSMRAAGIKNVLMIDAGGNCGQTPDSVIAYGAAIVAADPLHNVMFSVHAYGYWYKPGAPEIGTWRDDGTNDPWSTDTDLTRLAASGLALYVGEFADSTYEPASHYDVSLLLSKMDTLRIGGAAWMMRNSHTENWAGVDMVGPQGLYSTITPFGVKVRNWMSR